MIETTKAATFLQCKWCQHEYNPMGASWCDCLTEDRTLVCPRCSRCFCETDGDWRKQFWSKASPALLETRRRANRSDYKPPKFLLRDEIKRPLVLIAEDNRLVHLLATKLVSKLGYGVVGAMNGQDAIELARIYEPDLILADALMPVLDGRETCGVIKHDPVLAGTPVVIMSSLYKSKSRQQEARYRYKADDYLVKPVNRETLRTTLEKHVGAASRG